MKRYIAIFIAICLLIAGYSASFAQGHRYIPKNKQKKHNIFYKIRKWVHRDDERQRQWNTGHTEFKNRKKKDQKRIARHHLNPYKPSKPDKHMPDLRKYEKNVAAKTDGSGNKDDLNEQRAKDREAQQSDQPAEKPAEKPVEKPAADKPAEKPADAPTDKPADKPSDKPASKPGDTPPEKPADTPQQKDN